MFRYKLYIWSDVAKCYRPSHGIWRFAVSSNRLLILKQLYSMHQVGFFLPFTDKHRAKATGYPYEIITLNDLYLTSKNVLPAKDFAE